MGFHSFIFMFFSSDSDFLIHKKLMLIVILSKIYSSLKPSIRNIISFSKSHHMVNFLVNFHQNILSEN